MKKKVLLTSVLTIVLCLALIAGSTYALFTSGNSVDITVTAGKVNAVATINQTLETYSLNKTTANDPAGSFVNGGAAALNGGTLVIDRMTPGDVVKFKIDVQNNSNVEISYRVKAVSTANDGTKVDLSDALVISTKILATDTTPVVMNKDGKSFVSDWMLVKAPNAQGDSIDTIEVEVAFPNGNPYDSYDQNSTLVRGDNYYQDGTAKITFTVEVVQGNGVGPNNEPLIP